MAALPAFAATGPRTAPAATSVFTIYLAPASKGGSDSHTGLTTSSPILTLARAQQVLQQKKPDTDVQVRITQGTYVAGETDWTYYIPGHTISFMPVNYVLGQGRPAGGDPVFAETSKHFWWWFHALEPAAATAPLHNGGTQRAAGSTTWRCEGYANGIGLDGQTGHPSVNSQGLYIKPSTGLNGNSVTGMTFLNIGDKYGPGPGIDGFGAILLTDSSGNFISNNTFDNIENTGSTTGQIHGIYDTHFSSTNTITLNKFENISAEAIKVRDRSNFNVVEHNTFIATGGVSAYRDQFCDQACVNANPGTSRQCASYGNKFYFNTIGTSFTGGQQNAWTLDPPGETYAGNSGCSIPAGEERLHQGSNTLAAQARARTRTRTRATLTAPDVGISFPLHTSGASIVDASGKPVRLALTNWYGAESPDYVVGGLKYQPVTSIISQIVAMGFNGVRLPWSNAMWESNPVVSSSVLSANPQFAGEHARTIFEQVVQDLANAGLMVVLDNHNSTAEWCCSTSDGNSLWYTSKYPQSAWIADWKSVASAFKGVPQVIGVDLRNEPRGTGHLGRQRDPPTGTRPPSSAATPCKASTRTC